MYQKKAIVEKDVMIQGEIKQLYNNCPKEDGWFGGKVYTKSDGLIRLTGVCPEKVSVGVTIQALCDVVDKGFGEEFEAKEVKICLETNRALENYLAGPNFPGIGHTIAQKLVSKFKKDTLEKIVNDPQGVQTTCGLTQKQMDTLVQGILKSSKDNQLLQAFPHLGTHWVRRILEHKKFKLLSYKVIEQTIRDNPYLLLSVIDNLTFKVVDEVALLDMKLAWDDRRRMKYVFERAFKQYMSGTGCTYVNLSDVNDAELLRREVSDICKLNVAPSFISAQLVQLSKDGVLVMESVNQEVHVYLKQMWEFEQDIIEECEYHLHGGALQSAYTKVFKRYKSTARSVLVQLKSMDVQTLSHEQEEAILHVFDHSLSCIIGGPGRGKTFLMKKLAQIWSAVTGGVVFMLAPTGKAVNRMKESTGWIDVQTIARFLKSNLNEKDDSHLITMSYSELQPRPEVLLLVDESSMIPFSDAAKLLKLCHECHIVFVGDSHQLPPVETGPFLHAMLASGVIPVYELVTNHRTKYKELGTNAEHILHGERLEPASCFQLYPSDDESAVQFVVQSYQNYLQQGAELSDIMIMSPINKGIGSVGDVNQRLQNMVNPKKDVDRTQKIYDKKELCYYMDHKGWEIPYASSNGLPFRIFDRVMNTKNHSNGTWKKYKYNDMSNEVTEKGFGYFNGDTGTIIRYYFGDSVESPKIAVLLDDNRVVMIELEEFKEWVFGYCITIHKSQGCEAPNCMLLLPSGLNNPWFHTSNFLNRNLLYTGVTRAAKEVKIFGDMGVLQYCISHDYMYRNLMLDRKLFVRAVSQQVVTQKD